MRRGFTLLEVMVAAAVLAIGCLGVLAMMLTTIDYNATSHDRTNAIYFAEKQLSILEIYAADSTNWSGSNFTKIVTTDGTISNEWKMLNDISGNYAVAVRKHDPDSGVTASSDSLFGELRVIWPSNDTNCTADVSKLDSFAETRDAKYKKCSYITLPFVLSKPVVSAGS